jgi:hypothetical protein
MISFGYSNPNKPERINMEWPEYTIESQLYLNISREMSVGQRLFERGYNFWTNLLPKLVKTTKPEMLKKENFYCDIGCKPLQNKNHNSFFRWILFLDIIIYKYLDKINSLEHILNSLVYIYFITHMLGIHGRVVKVIDFKPFALILVGSNPSYLEEPIQLAYRTSVIPDAPEVFFHQ